MWTAAASTTRLAAQVNWLGVRIGVTQCSVSWSWLVSWSLTSPFSTNMAISETTGQGWRAIPTQYPMLSLYSSNEPDVFMMHHKYYSGIIFIIINGCQQ